MTSGGSWCLVLGIQLKVKHRSTTLSLKFGSDILGKNFKDLFNIHIGQNVKQVFETLPKRYLQQVQTTTMNKQ